MYKHTYICTYIRTYIYVHTYIRRPTYVHTYIQTYICPYAHTCIQVHTCIQKCTYVQSNLDLANFLLLNLTSQQVQAQLQIKNGEKYDSSTITQSGMITKLRYGEEGLRLLLCNIHSQKLCMEQAYMPTCTCYACKTVSEKASLEYLYASEFLFQCDY